MGYQGQPFRPEADERAMWNQAETEEEKLVKAGKIYEDPLLEEYLSGLAARLVPAEIQTAGAPPIRVAVFRDPALNAFAMPNGKVYLHTGLLARVENEAQLAAILGHELTHVTSRHALKFNRDARNKGLPLAFLAAVNGYGRDLEREADLEGMERMVRAGYDPGEAPRVFELLKRDHGDSGRLETFLFGNHPQLEERIATTRELLRTRYAGLDASRLTHDTEEFPLRTRVVVRENAALDIRAGRFGLARAQLDRAVALAPRDPVTHLYYGDLYRLQAQRARRPEERPPLVGQAREAYQRAAGLDPAYPDPFRQLGYLYYQTREIARAREAFQRYLALRPDAPDARRVKEYLAELDR
ncbi:MAG: tetratricopeptide repeat protein [Candidatus Rokubacteria bacterium]|nr:tetratricopeptide repeat protein [Candidatus Rokubacteria bacterium]